MAKSYTSLKAIIIAKITALLGSDGTALFAQVSGVNDPATTGYPACFVVEKPGGGKILDTHRNEREWQFSVTIHQEIGTKTTTQAAAALLDATDRVIESFDQDPMLNDIHGQSQCQMIRVVPVQFDYGDESTKIQRALLTVAVVDCVNRWLAS